MQASARRLGSLDKLMGHGWQMNMQITKTDTTNANISFFNADKTTIIMQLLYIICKTTNATTNANKLMGHGWQLNITMQILSISCSWLFTTTTTTTNNNDNNDDYIIDNHINKQ